MYTIYTRIYTHDFAGLIPTFAGLTPTFACRRLFSVIDVMCLAAKTLNTLPDSIKKSLNSGLVLNHQIVHEYMQSIWCKIPFSGEHGAFIDVNQPAHGNSEA